MRPVREFTSGDPGTTKSVARVYRSEPGLHTRFDCVPTPEMMEYMMQAIGPESPVPQVETDQRRRRLRSTKPTFAGRSASRRMYHGNQ